MRAVADVCQRITSGGTPARSRAHRYYAAGGYPWVKTKELLDRPLHDTEEHITDAAIAESAAKLLPPRTVLVAMYGATVGRLGVLKTEAACNQACCALVVDEALADHRFVFYGLLQHRQRLQNLASGAAQQNINARIIKEFELPFPSRTEQERIGSLLALLDEKIDSNRRLAALLEETVTNMFRARFVDFLGESDFVETELGRLPRGWTVDPIGDVLKVVGGGTPSTKESRYWDGGTHCWATPKDLAGTRSSVLLDTARHITDEGVARISSRLLPERTVLLSSRAPVGYTALSMVEVAVNQGFIAIPPSDSVPSEYVLLWLRENMDRIKAHAGGTTFAEISKRAFRPLLMPVPPASLLTQFERATRPMFDLVAGQEREIQALSRIRDALLPKLVSGEIRVPGTRDPIEAIGALAEEVPA